MKLARRMLPVFIVLIAMTSGCSVTNTVPSNPFIYVSTNGSDANNGKDMAYPLRTIQSAVNQAGDGSIICVTVGMYMPGAGLNAGDFGVVVTNKKNIVISGGWNLSFNNNAGTSVLNGGQTNGNVLYIQNSTGLTLYNFTVTRGTNTGIYINNLKDSFLSNLTISNNTGLYGGGLYLAGSNNRVFAAVLGNSASSHGGGLYLVCRNSEIDCVVSSNSSTYNGGGIYINNSYFNTIGGTVSGNTSQYGGGVRIQNSESNTFNGTNSGNTAVYLGGGYYFFNIVYHTVSGPVFGNRANLGGGLYLENSYTNTVGGNVLSNIANYEGGGICFYKSSGNIMTGAVSFNSNWGVYIETNFSMGNVFSLVTNNYSGNIKYTNI